MEGTKHQRFRGVRVDIPRLDFEVSIRETYDELATRARLAPETLTRIRGGRAVNSATLRVIGEALVAWSPMTGAALIVAAPEAEIKKDAAVITSAASREVDRASGHPRR